MELHNPEQIKEHLMATNDEFRKSHDEHHQYDVRLADLASRTYLTEDEQLEEVRLKKLKLHLKTQMQQMIDEYRLQHVG